MPLHGFQPDSEGAQVVLVGGGNATLKGYLLNGLDDAHFVARDASGQGELDGNDPCNIVNRTLRAQLEPSTPLGMGVQLELSTLLRDAMFAETAAHGASTPPPSCSGPSWLCAATRSTDSKPSRPNSHPVSMSRELTLLQTRRHSLTVRRPSLTSTLDRDGAGAPERALRRQQSSEIDPGCTLPQLGEEVRAPFLHRRRNEASRRPADHALLVLGDLDQFTLQLFESVLLEPQRLGVFTDGAPLGLIESRRIDGP